MWIEEYRRRTGNSRAELARQVRRRGVGCSPELIEILELGGKTIPQIADRIALVCGATDEQYDEIVLDKHKGKRAGRRRRPTELNPKPKLIPASAIAVVAMDEMGREIERYDSIGLAALRADVAPENVRKRCNHEILGNEYGLAGRTWRFAREYDGMNTAQRICDALEAAKPIRTEGRK